MKIPSYDHLNNTDKLHFIKLLIFIEGLEAKARFEDKIKAILK